MKLLLVVGRFPQLSETFIFRKAVILAQRGHDITILSHDDGDWAAFKEYLPLPPSLKVVVIPPATRLRSPARILRMLSALSGFVLESPTSVVRLFRLAFKTMPNPRLAFLMFIRHLPFLRLQPEIVHYEFLGLITMYPLAAMLSKAPETLSCRGADIHTFEQRPSEAQQKLLHFLQTLPAIHAVSQEMADSIQQLSGRSEGVWINRPAVDTDAITPPATAEAHETLQIVAIGRLIWKKGFDYLLAALAKLQAQQIPFHVKIIGGGELHAKLQFSIWDMGLTDQVELCGEMPPAQVLEQLQHADIFVLSSHEEGISNAVLEAMATGLPIVTTNAGGMAEAITDDVDGLIVPVRDVDALADRLARLLTDPELRKRLGAAARQRTVADFSLEHQAETFEAMFSSVRRDAHVR